MKLYQETVGITKRSEEESDRWKFLAAVSCPSGHSIITCEIHFLEASLNLIAFCRFQKWFWTSDNVGYRLDLNCYSPSLVSLQIHCWYPRTNRSLETFFWNSVWSSFKTTFFITTESNRKPENPEILRTNHWFEIEWETETLGFQTNGNVVTFLGSGQTKWIVTAKKWLREYVQGSTFRILGV